MILLFCQHEFDYFRNSLSKFNPAGQKRVISLRETDTSDDMAAVITINNPDKAAWNYSFIPENSAAALGAFWIRHFFLLLLMTPISNLAREVYYIKKEKKKKCEYGFKGICLLQK